MANEITTRTISVVEIPTTARPQTFVITLAGTVYMIRQYWLIPGDCWVWDIMTREGNRIISGIPLVTGTNLIRQFQHTDLKGILFVRTDHADEIPDFVSLGITGHVYYRSSLVA